MKHLGRDRFTIGVLLAAVVVLAALPFGIKSGSQRTSAQSAPSDRPVYHTQDVYLIGGMQAIDGLGNVTDLLPTVLNQAESDLGPPTALYGGLTLRQARSMGGRTTDANGNVIPNITVDLGVLTNDSLPGSEALIAVSSADLTQAIVNLDETDSVRFDIGLPPGVGPGATANITYAFVQTLMPDDLSTEAGLSGMATFVQRWNKHSDQIAGVEIRGSSYPLAVTVPLNLLPPGGATGNAVYADDSGGATASGGAKWVTIAQDPDRLTNNIQNGAVGGGAFGLGAGAVGGYFLCAALAPETAGLSLVPCIAGMAMIGTAAGVGGGITIANQPVKVLKYNRAGLSCYGLRAPLIHPSPQSRYFQTDPDNPDADCNPTPTPEPTDTPTATPTSTPTATPTVTPTPTPTPTATPCIRRQSQTQVC